MAHLAGIHVGKARALTCLCGGVAERAIQPQARMPLVAECDLGADTKQPTEIMELPYRKGN